MKVCIYMNDVMNVQSRSDMSFSVLEMVFRDAIVLLLSSSARSRFL
jgi:hypothetical protein